MLEGADVEVDLEEFRYKPECNLHPRADSYNMQFKALRYLALEKPTLATEVYTNMAKVDDSIEVSNSAINQFDWQNHEAVVKKILQAQEDRFLLAYQ